MVSFTAVATFVFAGFAATALAIPGASDNTWATMQKNNCGPQQVISCCNSDAESKQANGVLGVALPASIPAAQCAQIPINAAIIGGGKHSHSLILTISLLTPTSSL
ncbi:hypothetical protein FN846DRAFT_948956 [Sphaerosporella brunnea]|uniref:Hydrophobin n=1 Tax=Sphaerosporella brunnea TaxID=1250544 RepID=A0A5J5EXF0_9PEZI|nr:hypothetical protein FN846DRAFT_948956 [Sphaerosporella brunnea]